MIFFQNSRPFCELYKLKKNRFCQNQKNHNSVNFFSRKYRYFYTFLTAILQLKYINAIINKIETKITFRN